MRIYLELCLLQHWLSLRRHHMATMWTLHYEGSWCLVSLDLRYQPDVQCLTQRLGCLVLCTQFWNIYELILWIFAVCQIFEAGPAILHFSFFTDFILHSKTLGFWGQRCPWLPLDGALKASLVQQTDALSANKDVMGWRSDTNWCKVMHTDSVYQLYQLERRSRAC